MSALVRAAVLEEVGQPAVIRELDLIEPRAGEVRVRMLASGVCHSDLHVRDGEWDRPTPIVMGHEGAGIVEAVGTGVESPRVGQLVALSWLIPCGVCRSCRLGRVWECPDSPSYRHTLLDGETAFRGIRSYCAIATMAEASVVPAAAAIPLPDGVDPAAAALIGCCVTTGVGAVTKTAAVRAGSTVAVIGLGGVGLSCVMGAVVTGASRIVAIDRVAGKLDAAKAVGATDTILADGDAASMLAGLRDLTDGGPDFVFEAIGRPSTVELAIAALPAGGTAVLVGMTPVGDRAAFEVYPFVDGSRRIIGSNYGSAEPAIDFPRYASWTLDGRLPVASLVDRRIGLDDVEDAFEAMRQGRYVRQVIEF
ncbi:MAG TPA: alcohol dehydrogenase catalytic domain-containing protein [Candidatus Limnocylindrales bacterium]|nr:alcohol dehydrogenase catalytic domain-containing protein [Candidatus Limnocylindrales bacterium]